LLIYIFIAFLGYYHYIIIIIIIIIIITVVYCVHEFDDKYINKLIK